MVLDEKLRLTMKVINLNENRNEVNVPEKKLKELGILKVISAVISEDEETKYRVIMESGETEFVSASKLLGEKENV